MTYAYTKLHTEFCTSTPILVPSTNGPGTEGAPRGENHLYPMVGDVVCCCIADRTNADENVAVDDAPPLRPLASLKWPYVPEESAYPDPLKRDDPKPLQLPQYEAIGPYKRPLNL